MLRIYMHILLHLHGSASGRWQSLYDMLKPPDRKDGDRNDRTERSVRCCLLYSAVFCVLRCCLLYSACCLLLVAHCSLLTAHCSLLTAHCPLPTAHYSLLTAHCSLPTAHCPLPTAHCPLPRREIVGDCRRLLGVLHAEGMRGNG